MSFIVSTLGNNLHLTHAIRDCYVELRVPIGYVGGSTKYLIEYLESEYAFHILFVFPTIDYLSFMNQLKIRKNIKAIVIVVGSILPRDNISFLLNNGVSGFISTSELGIGELKLAYNLIKVNGYLPNHYISQEWWDSFQNQESILPQKKPVFSTTEFEIATYLVNGKTISQIAGIRNKSESSIRFHIKNLLQKSETYSIREFLVVCLANMWVKIDMNAHRRVRGRLQL